MAVKPTKEGALNRCKKWDLSEDFTLGDVKRARKELGFEYHPDRQPESDKDTATEILKEANADFDYLILYLEHEEERAQTQPKATATPKTQTPPTPPKPQQTQPPSAHSTNTTERPKPNGNFNNPDVLSLYAKYTIWCRVKAKDPLSPDAQREWECRLTAWEQQKTPPSNATNPTRKYTKEEMEACCKRYDLSIDLVTKNSIKEIRERYTHGSYASERHLPHYEKLSVEVKKQVIVDCDYLLACLKKGIGFTATEPTPAETADRTKAEHTSTAPNFQAAPKPAKTQTAHHATSQERTQHRQGQTATTQKTETTTRPASPSSEPQLRPTPTQAQTSSESGASTRERQQFTGDLNNLAVLALFAEFRIWCKSCNKDPFASEGLHEWEARHAEWKQQKRSHAANFSHRKLTKDGMITLCRKYNLSLDCNTFDVERIRKEYARDFRPDKTSETHDKAVAEAVMKTVNADCDYLLRCVWDKINQTVIKTASASKAGPTTQAASPSSRPQSQPKAAPMRTSSANDVTQNNGSEARIRYRTQQASTGDAAAPYRMNFGAIRLSDPEFVRVYNDHLDWCVRHKPTVEVARERWTASFQDYYQPWLQRKKEDELSEQAYQQEELKRQETDRIEQRRQRFEQQSKQEEPEQIEREKEERHQQEQQRVEQEHERKLNRLHELVNKYQKRNELNYAIGQPLGIDVARAVLSDLKTMCTLLPVSRDKLSHTNLIRAVCAVLFKQCLKSQEDCRHSLTDFDRRTAKESEDSANAGKVGGLVGGVLGLFGGPLGMLAGAALGAVVGVGVASQNSSICPANIDEQKAAISEQLEQWTTLVAEVVQLRKDLSCL